MLVKNILKEVAEMFGSFRYFLYLCSVNEGESKSACSDPQPPNLGGFGKKREEPPDVVGSLSI